MSQWFRYGEGFINLATATDVTNESTPDRPKCTVLFAVGLEPNSSTYQPEITLRDDDAARLLAFLAACAVGEDAGEGES